MSAFKGSFTEPDVEDDPPPEAEFPDESPNSVEPEVPEVPVGPKGLRSLPVGKTSPVGKD